MASFDASHAWDMGYHYAVRGICRHVPSGTWMASFGSDFLDGWDSAVRDGNWNTYTYLY